MSRPRMSQSFFTLGAVVADLHCTRTHHPLQPPVLQIECT